MADEPAPQVVMVAGPNGSGKSTLNATLRASPDVKLPALYINADDIQREENLTPQRAQVVAKERRQAAIAGGVSFMYETVMSHPERIAEFQSAAKRGYETTMFFVALSNPELNAARVNDRVAKGGHNVPRELIAPRYNRTLALAPSALQYASKAVIFDNSSLKGIEAQAELVDGRLEMRTETSARWVSDLAAKVNERANEVEGIQTAHESKGVALRIPNLQNDAIEGKMIYATKNFALQLTANAEMYLHDKALLKGEPELNKAYEVRYSEGVATLGQARQRDRER